MDDVLRGPRRGRERARRSARRDRGHRARLPVRRHAPGAGELALAVRPIPRITAAPDYPWAHDPDRRETFIDADGGGWGEGVTVDAVSPAFAGDPGLRDWFARMERLAVGPAAIEPTMRVIGRTDVRDVLPLIRVPTLVMRRRDDSRVDRRHAEYVARPRARRALRRAARDRDACCSSTTVEPIVDEIEELVTGTRAARPPERVLATVLFTDIVGSTERASEVGDRRWRELLDGHHALVRSRARRPRRRGGQDARRRLPRHVRRAGPRGALRARGRRAVGRRRHPGACRAPHRRVRAASATTSPASPSTSRRACWARRAPARCSSRARSPTSWRGRGCGSARAGVHALRGVPGEWELFEAADQPG